MQKLNLLSTSEALPKTIGSPWRDQHRAPWDLWTSGALHRSSGRSERLSRAPHNLWSIWNPAKDLKSCTGLQWTCGEFLKHCKGLMRGFRKVHKAPQDLLRFPESCQGDLEGFQSSAQCCQDDLLSSQGSRGPVKVSQLMERFTGLPEDL